MMKFLFRWEMSAVGGAVADVPVTTTVRIGFGGFVFQLQHSSLILSMNVTQS